MEIEETINELIEKGEKEYITDYIDGYICGYIQGYLKKMLTKEMIERRLNLAEEMIQKEYSEEDIHNLTKVYPEVLNLIKLRLKYQTKDEK